MIESHIYPSAGFTFDIDGRGCGCCRGIIVDDAVLESYFNLHIAAAALHIDGRAALGGTVREHAVAHHIVLHRTIAADFVL